jgi:hypothetical protein
LRSLEGRELTTEDYDVLLNLDHKGQSFYNYLSKNYLTSIFLSIYLSIYLSTGPKDFPSHVTNSLPLYNPTKASSNSNNVMASVLDLEDRCQDNELCWCKRNGVSYGKCRILPCKHIVHECCLKSTILRSIADGNRLISVITCSHTECNTKIFRSLNRRRKVSTTANGDAKKKQPTVPIATEESNTDRSTAPIGGSNTNNIDPITLPLFGISGLSVSLHPTSNPTINTATTNTTTNNNITTINTTTSGNQLGSSSNLAINTANNGNSTTTSRSNSRSNLNNSGPIGTITLRNHKHSMRSMRTLSTSSADEIVAGAYQMQGVDGVGMNMSINVNISTNGNNNGNNISNRNNRSEGRIIKQSCKIRPPLHKQIKNNSNSPVGGLVNLFSGHSYDSNIVLPDVVSTRISSLSANSGMRNHANNSINNSTNNSITNSQPIAIVRRNIVSPIVKRTINSNNIQNNPALPPLNASLTMNSSGGIDENIGANGINNRCINGVIINSRSNTSNNSKVVGIKQAGVIRSKSPIIRPLEDDGGNTGELGLSLNINQYSRS